MSTVRSFHSSVGISARRRSISASPVETIWTTAAWPASRSRVMDWISVGVFMLVSRWPKKRCLAHFERRARGGFGLAVQRAVGARDVRRLHRRIEVVVNDGEGAGIGIVDAALFVGQPMLDQFIFDAVIGQRPCGIEAERA